VKYKLDPELVRLVAAITAGVQAVSLLAGLGNVIGDKWAFGIVALGVMLQAMLVSYAQGHATPTEMDWNAAVRAAVAELSKDGWRPPGTPPDATEPAPFAVGRAPVDSDPQA